MMMVRSYLGPSSIEGLGVFSQTNIKAGMLIWRFDPAFDVGYYREEIDRVPAHFREFLERYTYDHPTDPERVVLDADEGRFMNHSDDPNIGFAKPTCGYAARDIAAGEELTCDYRLFTRGLLSFHPPRNRVQRARELVN